jgi:flagellar FliJ protein
MAKPKKSKRFKYNLASALRVRIIRETLQKEEVQKAKRNLEAERQKLKEIQDKQEIEHNMILEMYTGSRPLDLDEVKLRKYQMEQLQIKEEEQKLAVSRAEVQVQEEEKKLLKAVRDRKILEKDREKKQKLWKKMMEKEDTKFLDDISVSRFFRANKGDDD